MQNRPHRKTEPDRNKQLLPLLRNSAAGRESFELEAAAGRGTESACRCAASDVQEG